MRHLILYITTLLLLLPAAAQAKSPLKARAEADTATLTMGDRTRVRVEVTTPELGGQLLDLPKPETDFHGLEFSSVAVDTAATGSGQHRLTFTITLQGFTPGPVTLPGFRYAQGGDTVTTAPLAFKVLPVELSPELGDPEQPETLTVHPEEPVQVIPLRWHDYIPAWTIWVVLALAVAALAFVLYKMYKKNGPAIFTPRKVVSPWERAMQRLDALKSSGMATKGQPKVFFTELTDILRQYLDGRFGINALEMTSTEILRRLRENPQTRLTTDQVRQVLELADFVKFAAATPPQEDALRELRTVQDFIQSTKPEEKPEEKPEDKPADAPAAQAQKH